MYVYLVICGRACKVLVVWRVFDCCYLMIGILAGIYGAQLIGIQNHKLVVKQRQKQHGRMGV